MWTNNKFVLSNFKKLCWMISQGSSSTLFGSFPISLLLVALFQYMWNKETKKLLESSTMIWNELQFIQVLLLLMQLVLFWIGEVEKY